ncbi:MAG: hypothetical protein AAGF12_00505 [Myxococcota bacterium]
MGSLIFSDGSVQQLTSTGQDLELKFKDYRSSVIQIRFHGVTVTKASEELFDYEVMDARFERSSDGWTLRLSDDDGEVLLELSYQDADFITVQSQTS